MSDLSMLNGKIAQLAGRQYGHVTRTQLLGLGLQSSSIGAWVARGELITIHGGVYAVGYRRVEPVARAMAAVLACGPGAVLSHDSALALWGLRRWPGEAEVLAPGCVRRPGIKAHRSRTLTHAQTTTQLGIRTTRVARALHDVRRRLTPRQRTRLANEARLQKLVTAEEANALLHHHRNPTRSGHEDALQRWIDRYNLPQPLINVTVAGYEVDAYWPQHRLIIELDDYATHSDPATFQTDRDRDVTHTGLALRTLRLTPIRLTEASASTVRRLIS